MKCQARSSARLNCGFNYESFTLEILQIVTPAKAGIQSFQDLLDPGFRRGDRKG